MINSERKTAQQIMFDELVEASRRVLLQWGRFGQFDAGQKYEMQVRIKALDSIVGAITKTGGIIK